MIMSDFKMILKLVNICSHFKTKKASLLKLIKAALK